MAEERETAKLIRSSWTNNNSEGRNRSVDRLSSLPNDILIGIISHLPLRLAIVTGSLSRRWRGLWTNTTSIDITPDDIDKLYKLDTINLLKVDTAFKEIIKQITSPFIDRFRLEFDKLFYILVPSMDTLIREICDRNIHELKVMCPYTRSDMSIVPSVIFQTRSLVSLELGSTYDRCWEFPDDCSETIHLPNLKKLILTFAATRLQWIEKLLNACPSLEELSLTCEIDSGPLQSLKCSNKNLRWLLIKFDFMEINSVSIKAPKLEYLDISAPKSATFFFEEEPIMLREAKIKFTDEENGLMSKFYEAISNVTFLTLNVSKIDNLPRVFRNATRLTLDMNVSYTLKTMSSILEMCPLLDVLTLNVMDIGKDNEQSLCPLPVNVSNLPRSLKRIQIEIYNCCKPAKCFLDLVAYLLKFIPNLEHFNLSVQGCQHWLAGDVERKEVRELMLCKLLYRCPMISKGCDVEFKGRYLKMSRKDGPKAWIPNGQVINFRPSPLKYFT
ncbi:F-box/FBD/LRR-repeat protein At5g22700-like [Silene latifolia]|uniref:F-box/FBD/LRR-repeat protein At5g22700-like n=1 Tax=Silene latifolia TaxID=37657 RepID=UPI003D77CF70